MNLFVDDEEFFPPELTIFNPSEQLFVCAEAGISLDANGAVNLRVSGQSEPANVTLFQQFWSSC